MGLTGIQLLFLFQIFLNQSCVRKSAEASLHRLRVDVLETLLQTLALVRTADLVAAIGLVTAPAWSGAHCALLGLLMGARIRGPAGRWSPTRPARCYFDPGIRNTRGIA